MALAILVNTGSGNGLLPDGCDIMGIYILKDSLYSDTKPVGKLEYKDTIV